jgi:hypothetical protein
MLLSGFDTKWPVKLLTASLARPTQKNTRKQREQPAEEM